MRSMLYVCVRGVMDVVFLRCPCYSAKRISCEQSCKVKWVPIVRGLNTSNNVLY